MINLIFWGFDLIQQLDFIENLAMYTHTPIWSVNVRIYRDFSDQCCRHVVAFNKHVCVYLCVYLS